KEDIRVTVGGLIECVAHRIGSQFEGLRVGGSDEDVVVGSGMIGLIGGGSKREEALVAGENGEVQISAVRRHPAIMEVDDGTDLARAKADAIDWTTSPAHPESPYAVGGEIRLATTQGCLFADGSLGRIVGAEGGVACRRVSKGPVEQPES